MRNAFGVSKGVKDLPKFLPRKQGPRAIRMQAHRATAEGQKDALVRDYGMTNAGKIKKSAFLEEVAKWNPVSSVGQAIMAVRNGRAINMGGKIAAPAKTSAGKMAAGRESPVFGIKPSGPKSNTPTASPGIHTAASSPSVGGGKTVNVGAPAKAPVTPAANKPKGKPGYRSKEGLWSQNKSALKNPWVIGGGATAAAGAGGYAAGRNR
jgi:hypothetical protein